MPKTFIIVNPVAGAGLGKKRWEKFSAELSQAGLVFEYRFTEYPNHAGELAREALQAGWTRLGIFGGDGTLNDALQGIMKNDAPLTEDLKLVLLPTGSSCDFNKKFPDPKSPMERFLGEETWAVDIFKVECIDFDGNPVTRYIFNNSSIGLISLANEKYNTVSGLSKLIKQISVDAAAITAGVKALLVYENITGDMKIDEEETRDVELCNLTVFKTPYFGGGMYYGVDVAQDDGELTLALIEATSRWNVLSMIPALYTGTVFKREAARHRQCRSFEISTRQPVFVETDGENIGCPPAQYSILPQALKIVL